MKNTKQITTSTHQLNESGICTKHVNIVYFCMKQNKNNRKKGSNYDAYIGCSNDRLFHEALKTLRMFQAKSFIGKKGDRKTFSMQFGE